MRWAVWEDQGRKKGKSVYPIGLDASVKEEDEHIIAAIVSGGSMAMLNVTRFD